MYVAYTPHQIQEHVYNLPESLHYGISYLTPDEGWTFRESWIKFPFSIYFKYVEYLTYDDALQIYLQTDDNAIRVVKLSRYLVNEKPIITEVIKCKHPN